MRRDTITITAPAIAIDIADIVGETFREHGFRVRQLRGSTLKFDIKPAGEKFVNDPPMYVILAALTEYEAR